MPGFNHYWDGLGHEPAKVGQMPFRYHPEDAAKAMNFSFWLYYHGINLANIVAERDSNAGKVIKDDLRAAATTGWGFGVTTLEEAFRHMASNDSQWTDKDYTIYRGALGSYGGGIPDAAFNFLTAIDSRLAEAKKLADQHEKASKRMEAALEGGTSQWQKVGEALSTIQTVSENMERFLWLVPVAVAGGPRTILHRLDAVVDVVEEGNAIAGKFLSAISDTQSAVETFDSAMRVGFTPEQGALLVALEKLAGAVPVLGEIYAQAISLIPVIAGSFESIVYTRKVQMLRALYDAGPGQTMPHVGSTH